MENSTVLGLGFASRERSRLEDGDNGADCLDQPNSQVVTTVRAFSRNDYTVELICALSLEMTAVTAVLDHVHPDLPVEGSDENAYTFGSICEHNVLIACLPAGVYGTSVVATVASHMRSSFSSISIGLMVGVGGSVPNEMNDIRLGDVVVSIPTPQCAAVVQHDHGKALADGQFHITGQLNKPPSSLLTAVSKLCANHGMNASQIATTLFGVFQKYPLMERDFGYPGQDEDVLFKPGCGHVEEGHTCSACDLPKSFSRPRRNDDTPRAHYGPIASGNQAMKHAGTRDRLAQQLGILCFEMKAAGLMDNFPCLIVRGICGYSDARKTKQL